MEWIDVNCRGGSARDHAAGTPTVEQLIAEMDRLQISEACVYSPWSEVMAADHANEQLFEDLAPHARLHAIPEVLPEGGQHFVDKQADAIGDLISRGAIAGVARLSKNKFPLTPWCAGEMLEAMQAARFPLTVFYPEIDPNHLNETLEAFPSLPILLQEIPRTGYNRVVYALMAKHKNLHLVCDPPQFVLAGIEYLVNRLGTDQLLWGTRFPVSEGGSAIAGIMYADIADEAKEAIANGTIKRLMGEVRRG